MRKNRDFGGTKSSTIEIFNATSQTETSIQSVHILDLIPRTVNPILLDENTNTIERLYQHDIEPV